MHAQFLALKMLSRTDAKRFESQCTQRDQQLLMNMQNVRNLFRLAYVRSRDARMAAYG